MAQLRFLLAGASLLLLAISVVGCGANVHAPHAAGTASMSAPVPASHEKTRSRNLTAGPASAPPCTATHLSAHGGRQGENMGAHMDVFLSDDGPAACVLSGLPAAVRLLRRDGSVLDTKLTEDPANLVKAPVLLKPHANNAGDLMLYWGNWCGPAPGPLQIQMTLPGDRGTVSAPVNGPPDYDYVPQCIQPNQPSTLQILAAYGLWR